MIKQVAFLLLTVGLFSASAEPLHLDQAIHLGITNDVRLVPYKSDLTLAKMRNDSSLIYKNPEFRIGTELNNDDPQQRASIRFYPPNPWQVHAGKGENTALSNQAQARYEDAALKTTVEIMKNYRELQCLEEEQALLNQILLMKQTFAKRLESQLSAGTAIKAQALLAHWAVVETKDKYEETKTKLTELKQLFARQIGVSEEKLTIESLKQTPHPSLVDPEKMALEALQNNLQLHLLDAQREQANARLSNAKSESVPWLNFVEVGYRTGSEEWELEVGLEIPLFTLSGTEKRLSYEAVSRRNIEIETLRQSMKFTVKSSARTYNSTVNEWINLQKQQGELIKKTEQYLSKMTPSNPQQMDDQLALKEKMIHAKFKLLNLRRRINQAKISLIILLGKTTS